MRRLICALVFLFTLPGAFAAKPSCPEARSAVRNYLLAHETGEPEKALKEVTERFVKAAGGSEKLKMVVVAEKEKSFQAPSPEKITAVEIKKPRGCRVEIEANEGEPPPPDFIVIKIKETWKIDQLDHRDE